jgi:hypothetical protein
LKNILFSGGLAAYILYNCLTVSWWRSARWMQQHAPVGKVRFSSSDGCERVYELWMFWVYVPVICTSSEHS